MMPQSVTSNRLKVFLRGARVLDDQEVEQLPVEKRNAAAAAGTDGLWIEVECPADSCSTKGDKITLPAGGVTPDESKGIWLNVFCPEDECQIEQPSDLP